MTNETVNDEVLDGTFDLPAEGDVVATGVAQPPVDPTPTFRNPVFDRLFKRAKLKSVPVSVEVDGEVFEFLAWEMSVAKKARFEAMMMAASRANNDEGDEAEELNENEIRLEGEEFAQLKAKVIAAAITTTDNQAIVDADELHSVYDMPGNVIEVLFKAAFDLNGLGSVKKAEADAENE